jgi:hypothetical protein
MHLLRIVPGLKHVAIHPDGEHAKNFDFRWWLGDQGFVRETAGKKDYAGEYRGPTGETILINPKSGLGDVVADIEGQSYVRRVQGRHHQHQASRPVVAPS